MKIPEPRRTSSGRYHIQLRLKGTSISITESTAAEAIKKAQKLKADYKAGLLHSLDKMQLTWFEAATAYIEARNNVCSPSTIRGYTSLARNSFKSVAKKPLSKINWQTTINKEKERVSSKTLKNAWVFVSSVLRENGLPVPKVTLPQTVKSNRPFLQPNEIKPFLDAISGNTCEIAALLGLHSLRRSEILGLDWSNVNLNAKTITICSTVVINKDGKLIRRDATKNASSNRTIPIMIPRLFELLSSVPLDKRVGSVVNYRHPNSLYKQITKVCSENGFPQIGIHGLRHSFASLAYHLGLSELQTMHLGGWSDYKTMRNIYTHLSELDAINASNVLTVFFNERTQ